MSELESPSDSSHYLSLSSAELDEASPAQLRARLERYHRIFAGSGCGFWEWSLDTNQLHWEGRFWDALGYDDDTRCSLTSAVDMFRFVHPDEFAEYREIGYQLGLDYVESGPLVRSSYHSERHVFPGLGRKEWERSK